MLAAGIEAVLVKVASAGLDPQLHLGRTLSDMLPVIERMHKKFGLDMCGEGGEYESLVVDCRLFKKRLVLDETQVVVDEEDSSVGNLRIIRCSCQEKVMSDPSCIPVSPPTPQLNEPLKVTDARVVSLSMPSLVIRSRLVQSSLMFPQPNGDAELRPDLAVANQLQALFSGLKSQLSQRGCELGDAVFVHLFLSDMSLFDQVNTEYSKHFHHRPASRSCIAVPLPAGVYVAMDVTLLCGSHDLKPGDSLRRVLHIRSRSQWAPQCIGPYSQANLLFGSIALVAGDYKTWNTSNIVG
jgi:diphthine-ammonia ligase